jgi:hypothetical protein
MTKGMPAVVNPFKCATRACTSTEDAGSSGNGVDRHGLAGWLLRGGPATGHDACDFLRRLLVRCMMCIVATCQVSWAVVAVCCTSQQLDACHSDASASSVAPEFTSQYGLCVALNRDARPACQLRCQSSCLLQVCGAHLASMH